MKTFEIYSVTKISLIILSLTSYIYKVASEKKVYCERIDRLYDQVAIGTERTCFLNNQTTIDSQEVSLTSEIDLNVKWINFDGNKKIKFLPIHVSTRFPNLKCFLASSCSIKTISRETFVECPKYLCFIFLTIKSKKLKVTRFRI